MGYSKEHIEKTRQRILDCAGQQFRAHGYDGVGIDKIMEAAGLTRGGFYAHFKSKSQLFAAVVSEDFDFTRQLRKLSETPPSAASNRLRFAVGHYLDAKSRDHIGNACTMASSAVDVPRSGSQAKEGFGKSLNDLVTEVQALSKEDGAPLDRQAALVGVATSVGALILARASDDVTAADILRAALAQFD